MIDLEYQTMQINMTSNEFTNKFKLKIIDDTLINYWKFAGEDRYFGKLRDNRFMFYYKPANITNSFTTIICGGIAEQNGSYMVYYKYSKLNGPLIFCPIFSAFSLLFGLVLIPQTVVGIIPFCMAVAAILPVIIKPEKSKKLLLAKLNEIGSVY